MTKRCPLEEELKRALDRSKIYYIEDGEPGNTKGLDFYLPTFNLYIEVKSGPTDRVISQLKRHPAVIVVQGIAFVNLLAMMLRRWDTTSNRLDQIYERADRLIDGGKLRELADHVNRMRSDAIIESDITECIGWLTATLPVKRKTFGMRWARYRLYSHTKSLLKRCDHNNWRDVLFRLR